MSTLVFSGSFQNSNNEDVQSKRFARIGIPGSEHSSTHDTVQTTITDDVPSLSPGPKPAGLSHDEGHACASQRNITTPRLRNGRQEANTAEVCNNELTILHHTTNGGAERIQLRHGFSVASRQPGRDSGFVLGSGGKRWLQKRDVFVPKPQVYELFRGFGIAYPFAWCRRGEIGAYGLYETGERTLPWWMSSHFVLMLVRRRL